LNKAWTALVIVFLLGWASSEVYSTIFGDGKESASAMPGYYSFEGLPQDESDGMQQIEAPKSNDDANIRRFDLLEKLLAQESEDDREKLSPYDWIKQDQIQVYNNMVIIRLKNPQWARFTDTKSMDPVIDSSSHALEIVPESEEEVHEGDIVAYESVYKKGIITHRVAKIGKDSEGWYAVMKGDNNPGNDPGRVRFSQIRRVVVAVIY